MRMSRAKTDKKDAMLIAEYGKTEKPDLWRPEAAYALELKQMQAYLEQLNKNRTVFTVQKEAFNQNPIKSETLYKSINSVIETIDQEMFDQLRSITEMGSKTSLFLIVISGGFSKFNNHKQLASYIGISPRIFESGTSVKGKSKICKMGMSKIRVLLYMCAWSAKRCNETCKALYDRLL